MPHTKPVIAARHTRRLCVACGYAGIEVQGASAPMLVCPSCGGDLYSRPPRSYAEMEGLLHLGDDLDGAEQPRVMTRLVAPSKRVTEKRGARLQRALLSLAMGVGAMALGAAAAWLVIILI